MTAQALGRGKREGRATWPCGAPSRAARAPGTARRTALQHRSLSAVTLAELTLTAALGASFLTGITSLGAVWLQQRRQATAADQEWRRNEERPIVARMLTLSADALAKWQQSAQARSDWLDSRHADPTRVHEDTKGRDQARGHWAAAMAIYEKLRFEAAQLAPVSNDHGVR